MKLSKALERKLREGYLSLSSARSAGKPGLPLLTSLNWPETREAEIKIENNYVVASTNSDNEILRKWTLGEKPPTDLGLARRNFREALDIVILLLENHKEMFQEPRFKKSAN